MTLPNDPNVVCGYWFLNTGTKDSLIAACEWHDGAYTEGSWHEKILTRAFVDRWFLEQMLLIAEEDRARIVRAYAFYVLTRSLGWLFWEDKKTSLYKHRMHRR